MDLAKFMSLLTRRMGYLLTIAKSIVGQQVAQPTSHAKNKRDILDHSLQKPLLTELLLRS